MKLSQEMISYIKTIHTMGKDELYETYGKVRHEVALWSCLSERVRPSVSPDESRSMNKELLRQCDGRVSVGNKPRGKFPSGNHYQMSC